jgi:hypothetical protein
LSIEEFTMEPGADREATPIEDVMGALVQQLEQLAVECELLELSIGKVLRPPLDEAQVLEGVEGVAPVRSDLAAFLWREVHELEALAERVAQVRARVEL